MHFLEFIAEQKIAEAERSGALRNLPGSGAPLVFDDDPLIPEDLRMAYKILKNAGMVPEEVSMLRDVAQLEALVRGADGEERTRAMRRLEILRLRLEAAAPGRAALLLRDRYRAQILERFAGDGTEPRGGA